MPPAVERAILEILSPVVERSVTIACYTTVELLVKDFAMEPDEGRMRKVWGMCVNSGACLCSTLLWLPAGGRRTWTHFPCIFTLSLQLHTPLPP